MDEARALFLSLLPAAQTRLRAAAGHKESINLRKLTRAVYPYVQTLADAQNIADYLEDEADGDLDVRDRVALHSAASSKRVVRTELAPSLSTRVRQLFG
jgi:hypothetical protein